MRITSHSKKCCVEQMLPSKSCYHATRREIQITHMSFQPDSKMRKTMNGSHSSTLPNRVGKRKINIHIAPRYTFINPYTPRPIAHTARTESASKASPRFHADAGRRGPARSLPLASWRPSFASAWTARRLPSCSAGGAACRFAPLRQGARLWAFPQRLSCVDVCSFPGSQERTACTYCIASPHGSAGH